MAPLLRRRLNCFYCGHWSAQSYTPGLSSWLCNECEAVNYLDEHGGITDPPVATTSISNVRYAQQVHRSTSPPSSLDTIFCQTCIKNQHLVAQNLADYLPSTDDPRYAEYEKNYAAYKANLEERYPQVCVQCEPQVRARLRDSTYSARTELLRQMMEKTRSQPKIQPGFSWFTLLLYVTALAWWLGFFGQILWNALGTFASPSSDTGPFSGPQSLQECFQFARQEGVIEESCVNYARPLSAISLGLCIGALWYNPALHRAPLRRISGLGEYYKLQFVINAMRLLAWSFLGDSGPGELDHSKRKGIHAVLLAVNVVASLVAYRTPVVNSTPKISFPDYSKPLVSTVGNGASSSSGQQSFTAAREGNDMPGHQFPINALATNKPSGPRSYPSTLVSEVEDDSDVDDLSTIAPSTIDDDAMDIDTPEKNSFTTYRSQLYRPPAPPKPQPTPFHGVLPAAPVSQAHKLRNPTQIFQKASESSKRNFFGDIHGNDNGTVSGHRREGATQIEMARPRFFGQGNIDTGLESLFNSIFSLNDEPPEMRSRDEATMESKGEEKVNLRSIRFDRLLSAPALLASTILWHLTCAESSRTGHVAHILALTSAGVVAGNRLADALRPSRAVWMVSDILILVMELGTAIVLASNLKSTASQPSPNVSEHYDNEDSGLSSDVPMIATSTNILPLCYLALMTLQEVPRFWTELRNLIFRSDGSESVKSTKSTVPSVSQDPQRKTATLPSEMNQSFQSSQASGSLNDSRLVGSPDRNTRMQAKAPSHGSPDQDGLTSSFNSVPGFSLGLGNSPETPAMGRVESWQGRPQRRTRGRGKQPWEIGGL